MKVTWPRSACKCSPSSRIDAHAVEKSMALTPVEPPPLIMVRNCPLEAAPEALKRSPWPHVLRVSYE